MIDAICPVCLAHVAAPLSVHIYWHEQNDKDPELVRKMADSLDDLIKAAGETQ